MGATCVPQCFTTPVKEKRIYRRGNWWGPRQKISNCLGVSDNGGSRAISYSFSKAETYLAGADVGFGLSWINMGYSVSKSYSNSETLICTTGKDWHCQRGDSDIGFGLISRRE